MPYIKDKSKRTELDYIVKQMNHIIQEPGDLPYLLHKYGLTLKPKFVTYAVFFGSIILFLFEFFKRIVSPYEDRKRMENGDVE